MGKSRVLLAAPGSGSGKTLTTCAILSALKKRGLKLKSFKCGPDYIDPMFHRSVLDIDSTNLDSFFAEPELLNHIFYENRRDADFSLVEGVMGYFDGLGGITDKASTKEVAVLTRTPVILVVNAKGMSLSVVALIKGFLEYEKETMIRGVIFNQVSPMMYPLLKKKVEEELGIKAYGYLPAIKDCFLSSRHLGLVKPDEVPELWKELDELAVIAEKSIDLDGILELGDQAPELTGTAPSLEEYQLSEPVRIAVARDEAFDFYYSDNLKLLEKLGAELVTFSPMRDEKLPENINGLLLGGGYPELYAKELGANKPLLAELREKIGQGLPTLAECGGFLYLHETLEGMDGKVYPMAGLVKGPAFRTPKLSRFGYITLEAREETEYCKAGETYPAHEFHYWDCEVNGDAFTAKKPTGKRSWACILADHNLMAGFPHFYYYGNVKLPARFLQKAAAFKKES